MVTFLHWIESKILKAWIRSYKPSQRKWAVMDSTEPDNKPGKSLAIQLVASG